MQVIRGNNQETGPMPTKIPGCHRLWPLQLLSGAVQTRATSVSEGFSEARTMRCFFISRCRPGCLGWWGPCDTFGNIMHEGIRLSHAAQVVQGLEVLFGAIHLASERCLLGLSTLFALIFSKTHFLSLQIHTAIHNHDYTHRIRDSFIFLD